MIHAKVMQSKKLITIIFLAIISIVIIVLFAACSIPANTKLLNDSSSEYREALADPLDSQVVNPANPTSTTVTLETPTVIPQSGARLLLEKHCTRCHLTQWIEQIEAPSTEWESIMAQMERLGVNLSEDEKGVLLNYLATTNVP